MLENNKNKTLNLNWFNESDPDANIPGDTSTNTAEPLPKTDEQIAKEKQALANLSKANKTLKDDNEAKAKKLEEIEKKLAEAQLKNTSTTTPSADTNVPNVDLTTIRTQIATLEAKLLQKNSAEENSKIANNIITKYDLADSKAIAEVQKWVNDESLSSLTSEQKEIFINGKIITTKENTTPGTTEEKIDFSRTNSTINQTQKVNLEEQAKYEVNKKHGLLGRKIKLGKN